MTTEASAKGLISEAKAKIKDLTTEATAKVLASEARPMD